MAQPAPCSDIHRHELVVGVADVDMLGHASNVAYVRWVQEAAVAHSEALGLGLEGYRELGGVFVVRRHEVDYLRSALGGESLVLETWIESWTAATSLRRTRILRGDEVLARAVTTWAFVDASTGRPLRVPEVIRATFARTEATLGEAD